MKIKFIFILSLTTTLCVAQQTVNIIPQPVSIQQQSGNFILTGNTAIQYNPQQKGLKKVAKFFNLQLKNPLYAKLPAKTQINITITKSKSPNLQSKNSVEYRKVGNYWR